MSRPELRLVPTSRRSPLVSNAIVRAHREQVEARDYPDELPCEPDAQAVELVMQLAQHAEVGGLLANLARIADHPQVARDLRAVSRILAESARLTSGWDDLEVGA